MALSKSERDALPESDFAFPRTRQCPMPDAKHAKMAWDMVDTTKGVTEEERHEARRRILRRAKELGMDTSEWSRLKAVSMDVSLSAMSLQMPAEAHPNKMPFSGMLVWLDEESDKPPQGSGGRRILVTKEAAERALPSLLGMGVNFTEKLDGHDPQKKIGIISEANIRNVDGRSGIYIDGFIYASDFPNAAARIRADKDRLGFSFEAQQIKLADPGADILAIEECVFTGAAILRKDKAAYETTTLAAHAEGQQQELEMTPDELKAILAETMKPLNERLDKIEASQKEPIKIAAANMQHMVEPHAKALEACADGMEAAGIGGHAERGHAVIARKMAAHLRAAAAMGNLPHIFRDHDFLASADDKSGGEAKKELDAIRTEMKASIDAIGTKIADLSTKAFNAAAQPDRKTISPEVTALLDKYQIKAGADEKITASAVDAALDAAKVTDTRERIAAKLRLQKEGLLAA